MVELKGEYVAYLKANIPNIAVDVTSGKISEKDKHIEELWDRCPIFSFFIPSHIII